MKKLKIYLDTSVINFLFADDAPEFQKITKEFFEKFVKTEIYVFYISETVLAEINGTKDIDKRNKLLKVLGDYHLNMVENDILTDIKTLSKLYIKNNIFTENSINDAFHVAYAVINEMDLLLSWNFKHLANIERERKITAVNLMYNYSTNLKIITPLEVLYNENI